MERAKVTRGLGSDTDTASADGTEAGRTADTQQDRSCPGWHDHQEARSCRRKGRGRDGARQSAHVDRAVPGGPAQNGSCCRAGREAKMRRGGRPEWCCWRPCRRLGSWTGASTGQHSFHGRAVAWALRDRGSRGCRRWRRAPWRCARPRSGHPAGACRRPRPTPGPCRAQTRRRGSRGEDCRGCGRIGRGTIPGSRTCTGQRGLPMACQSRGGGRPALFWPAAVHAPCPPSSRGTWRTAAWATAAGPWCAEDAAGVLAGHILRRSLFGSRGGASGDTAPRHVWLPRKPWSRVVMGEGMDGWEDGKRTGKQTTKKNTRLRNLTTGASAEE